MFYYIDGKSNAEHYFLPCFFILVLWQNGHFGFMFQKKGLEPCNIRL